MNFQPYPTRSGYVTLGVAVLSGATAIYLLNLILQPDQHTLAKIFHLDSVAITFLLFAGCLLALVIAIIAIYWAVITIKLHYHLNRNGLVIQWGLTQYRIPFENIQTVIPGKDLSTPAQFWGLNLAGLRLGRGRLAEYGPLKFHATAPLADSLLVVTPGQTYVISPRQPDHFLQAWQARQPLGPTQQWSTGVQRSWPLNTPLLVDPLAWWLLGIAGALWLALWGYLALTFSELPASLPAAGAIVLVVNALLGELVYRRERVAAYLLWGSAIVMQVCLGAALLTITG